MTDLIWDSAKQTAKAFSALQKGEAGKFAKKAQ